MIYIERVILNEFAFQTLPFKRCLSTRVRYDEVYAGSVHSEASFHKPMHGGGCACTKTRSTNRFERSEGVCFRIVYDEYATFWWLKTIGIQTTFVSHI